MCISMKFNGGCFGRCYCSTVLQCPPSTDFVSGLIPGADHPETLPEGLWGAPRHTCHSWMQDGEREIRRWWLHHYYWGIRVSQWEGNPGISLDSGHVTWFRIVLVMVYISSHLVCTAYFVMWLVSAIWSSNRLLLLTTLARTFQRCSRLSLRIQQRSEFSINCMPENLTKVRVQH